MHEPKLETSNHLTIKAVHVDVASPSPVSVSAHLFVLANNDAGTFPCAAQPSTTSHARCHALVHPSSYLPQPCTCPPLSSLSHVGVDAHPYQYTSILPHSILVIIAISQAIHVAICASACVLHFPLYSRAHSNCTNIAPSLHFAHQACMVRLSATMADLAPSP